jgi:hypothetical protein
MLFSTSFPAFQVVTFQKASFVVIVTGKTALLEP